MYSRCFRYVCIYVFTDFHTTVYNGMLELKLNHISKRDPADYLTHGIDK